MPSPKPDDPLRCVGSDTMDFERREVDFGVTEVWLVCNHCKRALKPLPRRQTLRPHRVRSRATRTLDQTRDVLARISQEEIDGTQVSGPQFANRVSAAGDSTPTMSWDGYEVVMYRSQTTGDMVVDVSAPEDPGVIVNGHWIDQWL